MLGLGVIFEPQQISRLNVQDFFTDTFSRGRGREGGGACCTRPVVLGAVLLIWLFSLSVALAVVRRHSLDRGHY